jgi:hypothetical protein
MGQVLDAQFPDITGTDTRKGVTGETLRRVALALANRANSDGTEARVPLRRIAAHAGCHHTTATRALVFLTELGAVRLSRPTDGRSPDVYDVDVGWLLARASRARANEVPQARAARALEARASARPRGAQLRPTSLTPAPPPVDDDVGLVPLVDEDAEAAARFFAAYRRGRFALYTAPTRRAQVRVARRPQAPAEDVG